MQQKQHRYPGNVEEQISSIEASIEQRLAERRSWLNLANNSHIHNPENSDLTGLICRTIARSIEPNVLVKLNILYRIYQENIELKTLERGKRLIDYMRCRTLFAYDN